MKTLITGATGLLGKHLIKAIPTSVGTWFTNMYHSKQLYRVDITNRTQVRYVMDIVRPSVVIHTAGIGNVDYAEQNYTETANVNVEGTKIIHGIAQDYDAQFVYISSNAVYDGDNPPYSEGSERHPINRYGNIKKQAENVVIEGRNWLIIRPFMLYGYPYPGGRKNWYTLVYDKLINKQPIKLVDDIYWQPTSASDCANVIWRLIQQSETDQFYNIAPNEKPMTLYKFARKIAKRWDFDKSLIEPVSSDYFPSIAKRPVNTQFDVSKIQAMDINMMTVKEGLKALE